MTNVEVICQFLRQTPAFTRGVWSTGNALYVYGEAIAHWRGGAGNYGAYNLSSKGVQLYIGPRPSDRARRSQWANLKTIAQLLRGASDD